MQKEGPLVFYLDLKGFKTKQCQTPNCKNSKICFNFHQEEEMRRNTVYSSVICVGGCNQENCSKAHNMNEKLYHPETYKKRYCMDAIQGKTCQYFQFCSLAHSDLELGIKPLHLMKIDIDFLLFHFKSEFCPFNKFHHDKFQCVYAHNWQDYK